jgi:hypothetical protein
MGRGLKILIMVFNMNYIYVYSIAIQQTLGAQTSSIIVGCSFIHFTARCPVVLLAKTTIVSPSLNVIGS